MAYTLKNDLLRVEIELPGEKYTGSRFDWNGTVIQIYYKGIPVLSEEKLPEFRNPAVFGRGLHNEFGIKDCIGYDEVPEGGFFPKIGTGWLKKDSKPYFFFTQYELERLDFKSEAGESKAVFECDSGIRNGYGYHYTKIFSIKENSLTIDYRIENTGTKTLSTTEYVHNFLQPGQHKTGPHLKIELPWKFDPAKLAENVNTDGILELKDGGIGITAVPDKEFFLGGILQARKDGFEGTKASWTVKDTKDGFQFSETDSFTATGSDMWGHEGALSPELFTTFTAKPGETVSWQREYTFADL